MTARSFGFDFHYPSRVRLGTGLIALLALVSTLGQFAKDWKAFDPRQIGNDGITLYENRFDRLKNLLPPRGVIGYTSDTEAYNIEFYLTQYALAPVIVDPKLGHPLVVGNFVNRNSAPQDATLTLRVDFGNGLRLYNSASK
jgi:hypothetical protein